MYSQQTPEKNPLERNKLQRILRTCNTDKLDIAEEVEFGDV